MNGSSAATSSHRLQGCAAADGLSDDESEARLYRPALARSSHQLAPDFGVVHQELKRPGVTLMLLWEEYASANPLAYKYTIGNQASAGEFLSLTVS